MSESSNWSLVLLKIFNIFGPEYSAPIYIQWSDDLLLFECSTKPYNCSAAAASLMSSLCALHRVSCLRLSTACQTEPLRPRSSWFSWETWCSTSRYLNTHIHMQATAAALHTASSIPVAIRWFVLAVCFPSVIPLCDPCPPPHVTAVIDRNKNS